MVGVCGRVDAGGCQNGDRWTPLDGFVALAKNSGTHRSAPVVSAKGGLTLPVKPDFACPRQRRAAGRLARLVRWWSWTITRTESVALCRVIDQRSTCNGLGKGKSADLRRTGRAARCSPEGLRACAQEITISGKSCRCRASTYRGHRRADVDSDGRASRRRRTAART